MQAVKKLFFFNPDGWMTLSRLTIVTKGFINCSHKNQYDKKKVINIGEIL